MILYNRPTVFKSNHAYFLYCILVIVRGIHVAYVNVCLLAKYVSMYCKNAFAQLLICSWTAKNRHMSVPDSCHNPCDGCQQITTFAVDKFIVI